MTFFNSYIFIHGKNIIIILLIFFFIGKYFDSKIIMILSLIFMYLCYYFFRIPRFETRKDVNTIFATAYGKVIKVSPRIINNTSYLQIAIFIGLLDPHVQYSPCQGYIKKMDYKKGEFNPAFIFKKSNYNERLIYHMDSMNGYIIFSQIAGQVARTIVSFVKPNMLLQQNQEIGLIKFGSRSDIFVPIKPNMKLYVKEGDYVNGGQSKIVSY